MPRSTSHSQQNPSQVFKEEPIRFDFKHCQDGGILKSQPHKEPPVFLGDNLCTLVTATTVGEMQNFHHGMSLQPKPERKQGLGAEENK